MGEFDLTIDPKQRLLIPSELRHQLEKNQEESLVVTLRGRIPCFYPRNYYQRWLSSQFHPEFAPSEEMVNYAHLKFAMATPLDWDAQGRVVLPEKMLTRTQLQKQVTMIGVHDHLELLNTSEWEARAKFLVDNGNTVMRQARDSIKPASASSKSTSDA